MKSIGFTGTRHGMTAAQKKAVRRVLAHLIERESFAMFHHGDCVGADAEAHAIVKSLGFARHQFVLHPPEDDSRRAFCDAASWYPEAPYLTRNRRIVDHTGVLVAAPYESREQPRGGTWSTYRYARQQGKRVILVQPDGKIVEYKEKK